MKLTEIEIENLINFLRDRKQLPDEIRRALVDSGWENKDGTGKTSNIDIKNQGYGESLGILVGLDTKMKLVFNDIRKVADTDIAVLIEGEKGTGKKTVAKTVHELSSNNRGPFIVIDCEAISEQGFDDVIFGTEKDSIKRDNKIQNGLIERAQGGTVFFNHIEELSLNQQGRLVPFFRDKIIYRIGGSTPIPISARIIASSEVHLKKAFEDKNFRSDIYFHINSITISLPPLRERDDIFLLAKAFLKRYAEENNKEMIGFTDSAYTSLTMYEWPGNVLELENRIRSAVIFSNGKKVTPLDLGMEVPDSKIPAMSLKEAKDALEKEMIMKSLARHESNLTKVAIELGISRPTLYDVMKKYNIAKQYKTM